MDASLHVNENSSEEDTVKTENETIITFGEDGLNYSDFENVEYEEVNGELIETRQDDEYTTSSSLKSLTRKRTRNFTQSECNILSVLLEDYADILEIKRNDHKTNTLKNKTWTEITQKFNDITTEEYRTSLQLKTFYENLKKRRKKLSKEVEVPKEMVCLDDCRYTCTKKAVVRKWISGKSSDAKDLTCNNFDGKSQSEKNNRLTSTNNLPQRFQKYSFMQDYQRRKMELVEREIEKVKSDCVQQRRLFLLQEEKLLLEIEEIKQRLKK